MNHNKDDIMIRASWSRTYYFISIKTIKAMYNEKFRVLQFLENPSLTDIPTHSPEGRIQAKSIVAVGFGANIWWKKLQNFQYKFRMNTSCYTLFCLHEDGFGFNYLVIFCTNSIQNHEMNDPQNIFFTVK